MARKKRKKVSGMRFFKIVLLIITLFLVNIYVILGFFYKGGNFTVNIESEFGNESGLIIYENANKKNNRMYLKAESIDSFIDMSIDWLPKDIDNAGDGSHNGMYYIAYTFYAENQGQETINYWSKITIDDVVKDVDEAIRVMVYRNDEKVVYGKINKDTGKLDVGATKEFESNDVVALEHRENLKVGDIDKYTIVIWLEGDDPHCTDELLGGSIKMHMTLSEEHVPDNELYSEEIEEDNDILNSVI